MLDFYRASADYDECHAIGRPKSRPSFVTGRAKLAELAVALGTPDQASLAAGWLEAIARHRDQAAFVALFRFYAPRIKTYLRRLGCEEGVAEELSQEAMLLVWRKSALFDRRRAAASTWIFAIARNLRIDRLRREQRPEMAEQDLTLAADPSPAADEELAALRMGRRLHALLRELPTDQATVVTLSFFEDVPHAEIALRLGLPLGTVKSRLRLAMQRLRGKLAEAT